MYPITRPPTLAAIGVAVAASLICLALWEVSWRLVSRRPRLVAALWTAAGFGLHLIQRRFYAVPIEAIIASDNCTAFFTVAKTYAPVQLLGEFLSLVPAMPMHAAANMPGKILIFHALRSVSTDPQVVGMLLIAAADLAGILVFVLTRRWFRSDTVALAALVLYELLPARAAFSVLANALSHAPIMGALLCLLLFLDGGRRAWLCVLGLLLYLAALVDPLTLGLGLIFVGVIVQRTVERAVSADRASVAAPPVRVWPIVVYPAVGFLAAYVVMRVIFGFDLVAVFLRLAADAVAFNQQMGRSYWIWLVDNLREFLMGAGVVGSIVLCVSIYRVAGDAIHDARTSRFSGALRRVVADPVANLLVFAALTLLTLDVMGLNRGEVTRLWIFLSVALQIAIAALCVTRYGPSTTRLVVATMACQSTLMAIMVDFLIC